MRECLPRGRRVINEKEIRPCVIDDMPGHLAKQHDTYTTRREMDGPSLHRLRTRPAPWDEVQDTYKYM